MLSRTMYLVYVSDKLSILFETVIEIQVDNQTAISFAKKSKLRLTDARQHWILALRDAAVVKLVSFVCLFVCLFTDSGSRGSVDSNRSPIDANRSPIDANRSPIGANRSPIDADRSPLGCLTFVTCGPIDCGLRVRLG